MKLIRVLLVILLSATSARTLPAQARSIAERLGHPAGTKLLIVHADDLGVSHSVDAASFDALDKDAVSSASIMMPCPWVTEVAAYARAHPDADLGLHLTLTSEWKTFRWGSVESRDKVPSLLDPSGTLWTETEAVAAHAKPEEAEREIRAQIDRAMALGIHPTHLDSHMGSLFSTPALFATLAKVAHEYHLPFLALRGIAGGTTLQPPLSDKDVVLDAVVIANEKTPRDRWKEFYLAAIKGLKPGLSEMIVHLGHDDAELQSVTVDHEPYGSAWRERDYSIVSDPDFKRALAENHVVVIKWRDLQKLVNEP
jgi:predicted glycoside hydrolase/deacetylase ChbG (UPF0249 family)